MNINDLRMSLKEALDNMWSRITSRFSTVDERVGDIDDEISSVESSLNDVSSRVTGVEGRMTTAEGAINTISGRVDDIEDAVDDIEGDMIKSISLNGINVPKDAQGNVALQESDPNVPVWAKQQKAKTSDFTNDGDGTDNNSPFATEAYVAVNGGKIDEVQVNSTPLPIVNKVVDIPVPTKTSDLINDSGFSNMETLHMTAAAWSYVDYIFSRLSEELFPYEIRPFIASNATISAITNQQISPSLWGFVYRWRTSWDCYRFVGVDNSNGDIYMIEVHTDQAHYEQNIVYVDGIYKK